MDQKDTSNTNYQEELEETLSLCDLPLEDYQSLSLDDHPPNSPSDHELFEFPSFTPNASLNTKNDIVFCGKLIKEQDFDDDRSGYLFPLSSARLLNNNKKDLGSLRLVDSKPTSSALSTKNLKCHSFSSSSSSSRKHRVLLGLAKVPPKMELSDIKKRQSRRNPLPMFPPVTAGDLEVVNAGEDCGASAGRRGHLWGLLRLLRCRARPASALAKATLGCIPHV